MKKTFFALLILLVGTTIASGASIKWSLGGALNPAEGKTIDTSVGSFVLAYIGTTSGVGVDAATFTEGVGSKYSIVDTADWADFYNSRRSTYNVAKSTAVNDVANATYQMFFVNNGVYSLVNDPTISTVSISIDSVTGAASVASFVDGASSGASTLYATGSASGAITSVPEPSTAALALAGLALLLKRRKA